VRITDASGNATGGARETIRASIATLVSNEEGAAVDDDETQFDLLETGPDSGVFESEAMLLMSPDLPVNPDDDHEVWTARVEGLMLDDFPNDRTHRASIDGAVRVVYARGGDEFERRSPVSQRDPNARRTLRMRVRVHVEPFMDTGIAPEAGAQIVGLRAANGVIEQMVYEFDPDAASVGEDDGWFTFVDLPPLNNKHDPGEPSEKYLDLSRGVKVTLDPNRPEVTLESFYLRGDEVGDDTIPTLMNGGQNGDGWGPVVTNQHVLDQIERANIGWAQAGIKIEMIDGPIIEAAPPDAGGVSVLHDGWMDFGNIGGQLAIDPRAAVQAVGDAATPETVEVIFSGPLTSGDPTVSTGGFALIPRLQKGLHDIQQFPIEFLGNTYIFVSPNLDLARRTLAHEIGHALTNETDIFFISYIFFPAQVSPAVSSLDISPETRRRIRRDTEATAIQRRDPVDCFECPGSTLFEPEG